MGRDRVFERSFARDFARAFTSASKGERVPAWMRPHVKRVSVAAHALLNSCWHEAVRRADAEEAGQASQ